MLKEVLILSFLPSIRSKNLPACFSITLQQRPSNLTLCSLLFSTLDRKKVAQLFESAHQNWIDFNKHLLLAGTGTGYLLGKGFFFATAGNSRVLLDILHYID